MKMLLLKLITWWHSVWPIHSVRIEADTKPTKEELDGIGLCKKEKPKKPAKHSAMQVAIKRNKKPRKKQPAKMKQEKQNGKA